MTANDTATRRVTTGIVLAVGLFAGSDSYSHIYTLARDHGQAIASAALLPLAGDGLIAAASSAMLVASRQGPRRAGAGPGHAAGRDRRHDRRERRLRAPRGPHGCAAVGVASGRLCRLHGTAHLDAAQHRDASGSAARICGWAADAPDELARRRHSPTGGLLDAAGRAFPAAGAGNVPSLREIQRALRIGQGKAQQVQAHLAGPSGGRGIGKEEPPDGIRRQRQ